MMRVLAVAGASGGHIFPAVSFLDALKQEHRDAETLLVLPKRNIYTAVKSGGHGIAYLDVDHFSFRKGLKNAVILRKLLGSFFKARRIVSEFNADVVVGFGSMVSVPVALAAKTLGKRIVIHEQNVIPGKANRLVAGFADKIGIAFEETKRFFPGAGKKLVLTGNPLRNALVRCGKQKALDFFGFKDNIFTLLVTGGSQGSHRINNAVVKAFEEQGVLSEIQVIHITGADDYQGIGEAYANIKAAVRIFKFLPEMEYAYSVADLVIARAGAITVTELIRFGIPAILIPYPYAAAHQKANAQVLQERNAALLVDDAALDQGVLGKLMRELIGDTGKRASMRRGYEGFPVLQAEKLLVQNVWSLVQP